MFLCSFQIHISDCQGEITVVNMFGSTNVAAGGQITWLMHSSKELRLNPQSFDLAFVVKMVTDTGVLSV